jgi:hypothetical protein
MRCVAVTVYSVGGESRLPVGWSQSFSPALLFLAFYPATPDVSTSAIYNLHGGVETIPGKYLTKWW